MKPLSVRARESIKTGLAMAVTIAIALRMEFLQPQWAGFAVAMISLDTAGQSLNKAALRMVGTLAGFVASLALMGLFPQQRWGMLLALSLYVGLCAYMVAGRKHRYAWFVAGFVCMTIMVHAGADSLNMFRYAVARVEETALGIAVYSLVSIFVWPRDSREELESASRELLGAQIATFAAYRGLMAGRGRPEDSRPLRLKVDLCLHRLEEALAAAETDTYQVWELRHAWRRLLHESTLLRDSLGRWRVSLPEVRTLPLATLLPGAEALLEELERRLGQIQRLLAGELAAVPPRAVELRPARTELRARPHFERGAVALLATELRRLDEVSRSLFAAVAEIRGTGPITSKPPSGPRELAFDTDRFSSAASVVSTLFVGFLIWVWLDPPGHASFWYSATLYALLSVLSGQGVPSLLPGFLVGIGVGGIAYVGVMPHLTSYAELGLLIFAVTAGSFYAFWGASRSGTRSACLAMFLSLVALDNEQSYSFPEFISVSVSTLLSVGLAAMVACFPHSPRPEKVFLRLLARFFRRAEVLVSRLAPDAETKEGFTGRWRAAWIRRDLLELPRKLVGWTERIDYRLLPGTTREQIRTLVFHLLDLALRIDELVRAREQVRPRPQLEEIVSELREWRLLAQEQLRLWSAEPSAALDPSADVSERLHTRLARMGEALDRARADDVEGTRVDYEKLYRYLGGFRGLSEAGIAYATVSGTVDWEAWREARF